MFLSLVSFHGKEPRLEALSSDMGTLDPRWGHVYIFGISNAVAVYNISGICLQSERNGWAASVLAHALSVS